MAPSGKEPATFELVAPCLTCINSKTNLHFNTLYTYTSLTLSQKKYYSPELKRMGGVTMTKCIVCRVWNETLSTLHI